MTPSNRTKNPNTPLVGPDQIKALNDDPPIENTMYNSVNNTIATKFVLAMINVLKCE